MTLPALRLVGLASYSIYLLHQPILSFARLAGTFDAGRTLHTVAVIALILASGMASWAWVERPFRRRARVGGLILVQVSLLSLAFALALTSLPQLPVSPRDRPLFATEWREARSYLHRISRMHEGRPFSESEAPKVLVIGDSFGKDFINALAKSGQLDRLDLTFHEISRDCGNLAVPPDDPELVALDLPVSCAEVDRYQSPALLARIAAADVVVLGSYWNGWHLPFLSRSLDRIRSLTKARILLLGPKAMGLADLRQLRRLDPGARAQLRLAPDAEVVSVSQQISRQFPDVFLDIQSLLCPELGTTGCPVLDDAGTPLSYDGYHLSPAGAGYLADRLGEAKVFDLFQARGD